MRGTKVTKTWLHEFRIRVCNPRQFITQTIQSLPPAPGSTWLQLAASHVGNCILACSTPPGLGYHHTSLGWQSSLHRIYYSTSCSFYWLLWNLKEMFYTNLNKAIRYTQGQKVKFSMAILHHSGPYYPLIAISQDAILQTEMSLSWQLSQFSLTAIIRTLLSPL